MDLEHSHSKKLLKFYCTDCDFRTSNKNDFRRHLSTRKHLECSDLNTIEQKNSTSNTQHICKKCNKEYKSRNGLWYHEKKCTVQPLEPEQFDVTTLENSFVANGTDSANGPVDYSILMELLKQNQEFKELIIEQNKTIVELATKAGNTTNNNQNIKQQNNNHFNIQMFLNETCKNAINLEDFIDSLHIDTQTIEYAGQHGHVNGITNIFMTGLKELDIHMRPIHCTDLKRETMYMKDADIWLKDNEKNAKMLAAIKRVSNLNMKQLQPWMDKNPESNIIGSEKYEEQIRIMRGILDIRTNKEKVLSNLMKEVLIDKNNHE